MSRVLQELTALRQHIGPDRRLSHDEAAHLAGALTRRRLLQWAGAAGTSILLGCTRGPSRRTAVERSASPGVRADHRVAVIGAGLAGLTAAYWLTRAGVAVTVFEARDRVGGRCWSARGFEGGQVAEHGGEFIDTRHVHLSMLAEDLGLELDDLWAAWIDGSAWPTYVGGEIVRAGELFDPLDEAAKDLVRIARRIGPWWASEAGAAARNFDQRSMADWFEAAVGSLDSPLGRAFRQDQAGWFGLDPERLSAINAIDYFVVEYPGSDERYTVHGGNDRVTARLLEALPGGTVRLEAPVEALRRRPGGSVELVVAGMASPVRADRVVVTVPFPVLRTADLGGAGLSPRSRRAIDELGMGTNAKLLLQLSEAPRSFDGWSGGMDRADDPMLTTWESSSTDGASANRLSVITVYSGGQAGAGYDPPEAHGPAPADAVDRTLQAMDAVVPGVAVAFNGRAWLDSWVDDPWARGSYAAYLPGQYSRFAGLVGAREGPIHFAGEHTSTFSQGFLNGGVESGCRVAIEVLGAIGIGVPPKLTAIMDRAGRYGPRYPWDGSPPPG